MVITCVHGCYLCASRYFENLGEVEKAVQLYTKGNDVNSAVELCFAHGLYSTLSEIGMFVCLADMTCLTN